VGFVSQTLAWFALSMCFVLPWCSSLFFGHVRSINQASPFLMGNQCWPNLLEPFFYSLNEETWPSAAKVLEALYE
jgi:hypothetical protein